MGKNVLSGPEPTKSAGRFRVGVNINAFRSRNGFDALATARWLNAFVPLQYIHSDKGLLIGIANDSYYSNAFTGFALLPHFSQPGMGCSAMISSVS